MAGRDIVKPNMAGGDGPNSYSQNSSYQRALLEALKERISKAISTTLDVETLNMTCSGSCNIADFGCSVGPNTFVAVRNIIDAVMDLASQNGENKNLEFHVFFNDHPSNDFNTLFRNLPESLNYFPAGVPGSFYGQVFPAKSLHLAHCSNSLQSVSRLPKEILDKESKAWNGGSIHCTGYVKEVKEAYFELFRMDIDAFLSARAKEMVPGGLVFLLGTSMPDNTIMSETRLGKIIDIAGTCLLDSADSGKISKEDVETFNLPYFAINLTDYKRMIEENGSYTIQILERVRHANEELPLDVDLLSVMARSTLGEAIANRFGTEFTDGYFMEHFKEGIEKNLHQLAEAKNLTQYFIMLRRN